MSEELVVDEETGEVIEQPEPEPDEEEAAQEAEREREQELAAQRQAEEQSLEAQKREQDEQIKKLNHLAKHVADRYKAILGDDLDGWVGCPLCAPGYPGIILPIMPDHETVNRVKAAIGEDPDPDLEDDPYSRQCDACGGHGQTKTNSHVNGQKSVVCIPCKGKGWVAVGPERASGAVTVAPGVAAVPPPENGEVSQELPPEAEALKQLGYIVVPPVQTVSV